MSQVFCSWKARCTPIWTASVTAVPEPFTRDVTFPLEAILVTELEDEENEDEWVFLLQGNSADLEDIITTSFVLQMGSRLLCAEDCKGLCCRGGANLNREACKCQQESDPAWLYSSSS